MVVLAGLELSLGQYYIWSVFQMKNQKKSEVMPEQRVVQNRIMLIFSYKWHEGLEKYKEDIYIWYNFKIPWSVHANFKHISIRTLMKKQQENDTSA